jgi:hypothetical protein
MSQITQIRAGKSLTIFDKIAMWRGTARYGDTVTTQGSSEGVEATPTPDDSGNPTRPVVRATTNNASASAGRKAIKT